MADERRLRLNVTIDIDTEPIHGTIGDGPGPPLRFSGWLELMSAFETVCAKARDSARETS